jgi:hypothetical protein
MLELINFVENLIARKNKKVQRTIFQKDSIFFQLSIITLDY